MEQVDWSRETVGGGKILIAACSMTFLKDWHWDDLTGPERMQRVHAMIMGSLDLTSKTLYGWVNDTRFTVVEALDVDGNTTQTLLCRATDTSGAEA